MWREGIFFTINFQKQSDGQMLTLELPLLAPRFLPAFPGENPLLVSPMLQVELSSSFGTSAQVRKLVSKHDSKGDPHWLLDPR